MAARKAEADAGASPAVARQTRARKHIKRRYTETEVERGLLEMALCDGNTRKASERLALRGAEIPYRTLQEWKTSRASRYADIRERTLAQVHERMAAECEALVEAEAKVEWDLVKHLGGNIEELNPKDAAGAIRNMATARGINTDKRAVLRGQPTEIVEHRNADDLLRRLQSMGIIEPSKPTIEGTAQEITQ